MLHRKRLRYPLYTCAKWGLGVSGFTNALGAIAGKLPVRPLWGAAYQWLQTVSADYAWLIVLMSTAAMTSMLFIMKMLGEPKTWETLHDLLDTLQSTVFCGVGYTIPDEHKVTIFKAVYVCSSDPWWRWLLRLVSKRKRWLVPVVRSGHTSQDTKTCFPLSDNADQCQGVAGQAWARRQPTQICDLPGVSGNPYKRDIETYATRSFVSIEWVKAKKPKSRAILAIPILIRGEPWGILVFDSRNSQKIRYEEALEVFKVVQIVLSKLISEHL